MKWKTAIFGVAMCAMTLATPLSFADVATAQTDATAVQSQESTWTGKIEQKELNGNSVYVFTVAGQSYMLEPQEKAAEFVGKTVKITGTVDGNTVTISQITEE